MLASISSAVRPSPGRTSANTARARSRRLAVRAGAVRVDPRIRGLLLGSGSGAAPMPPALNASARVKARKRRHGHGDFDGFFGGEGSGKLREMTLPPHARPLVVPAAGRARAVDQAQQLLGVLRAAG